MNVRFYDTVSDEKIKFSVIAARYNGEWVFVRHKDRDTFELPGGHRESGETPYKAACRELYEETGAEKYEMKPVCVYGVEGINDVNPDGGEAFGILYFAEISEFSTLPESEIGEVKLFSFLPDKLTYPDIVPKLCERAMMSGYFG